MPKPTNKIVYDLQKGLNEAKDKALPFLSAVSGYVFLGRKNHKDGSFSTTCWLTFFYLPIIPLETYVITSQVEKRLFPRVFGLDEFIHYDRQVVEFDHIQVLTSSLIVWVPVCTALFLLFVYPLISLAVIFLAVAGYSIYQLRNKSEPDVVDTGSSISDLKSRLKEAQIMPQPTKKAVPAPATPIKKTFAEKIAPPPNFVQPKPYVPKFVGQKKAAAISTTKKQQAYVSIPPKNYSRYASFVPAQIHEEVEEKKGPGLIFFGILNILVIFGYLITYGYFRVDPEVSGYGIWAYKIFSLLNKAHLISLVSFNVGLYITLFRSKFIGVILIILAVCLFFNLDIQLWDYLFKCCL